MWKEWQWKEEALRTEINGDSDLRGRRQQQSKNLK